MIDKKETLKKNEKVEADLSTESLVSDSSLDAETVSVEGRALEVTRTSISENKADDDKVVGDHTVQIKVDDQTTLKSRLLENAPAEPKMRTEVRNVLLKEKDRLESDVAKYKRTKKYHLLSIAIMKLRLVIRQLEELAKLSYETLKELWLKAVHNIG